MPYYSLVHLVCRYLFSDLKRENIGWRWRVVQQNINRLIKYGIPVDRVGAYFGERKEILNASITPDLRYLVGSDANFLIEKRKSVPERKFLEFMSQNILGS